MIISFGYDNGEPTRVKKVFDVQDLTHDTDSPQFAEKLRTIVEYGKAHPGDQIGIGCAKGHHRSVVLANKAATQLRTGVYHRDRAMQ